MRELDVFLLVWRDGGNFYGFKLVEKYLVFLFGNRIGFVFNDLLSNDSNKDSKYDKVY